MINESKKSITKQIRINEGLNLFYSELEKEFSLTEELISLARKLPEENVALLIDYTTTKVFNEFCKINQYYSFNKTAKDNLKIVYKTTYINLKNNNLNSEKVAELHLQNLKKWLLENNGFAEKMYSVNKKKVKPVACSEYSPELQLEILGLDLSEIKSPILDVGCGKKASLVVYLAKKGFEIYGIDRFSSKFSNVDDEDWLTYNFGVNKWGTVISHLGFSNHFLHHHLRTDGNYIGYAKKYIEILNSLKNGGCFYYTPELPFIEQFLDKNLYDIKTTKIEGSDKSTTRIIKH